MGHHCGVDSKLTYLVEIDRKSIWRKVIRLLVIFEIVPLKNCVLDCGPGF